MPAELIPAMLTILAVDPYPVQMVPGVARPTLTIEQPINSLSLSLFLSLSRTICQLGYELFDN